MVVTVCKLTGKLLFAQEVNKECQQKNQISYW